MWVGDERGPWTRRHQTCIATEVPKGNNPIISIGGFEMLREGRWIRAQLSQLRALHQYTLEGPRRGHPGNWGRFPEVGIVGRRHQEPDEEVAEVAITLPAIYDLVVGHRLPVAQNLDLANAATLQPLDLCIPLHINPAYRYWREMRQSSHRLHLVGLNKNNIKFK